jgi:predicted TIM-barrel fold metal-dependent hydrolase
MRFDSHAHVWVLEPSTYPWHPILPGLRVPDHAVPAERLLGEMDEAGVARTVVVQPSSYGWDNSYLLAMLERHPERLVGVVLVDPSDEPAQAMRALSSRPGIRGVRFHLLDAGQAAVFAPVASAICRTAADSGMVVDLQARPGNIELVGEVAGAAPETTIVVDHMGLVEEEGDPGRLLRLAAFSNVHLKISGFEALSKERYPFEDLWSTAHSVVEAFGADRLMWGSNFPHVTDACSYRETAALVDLCYADLPDSERAFIAYGTADRVWGGGV